MNENTKQPKMVPTVANVVINALKGGVVPRKGLPYITVGRKNEIEALLNDVEIIKEGGASFRFIVGKYGSGKSFLIQTMRNHVMNKGFVVADADLSPERKLHSTNGQGLATYRELIQNLAVKAKPDQGALPLILNRWIDSVKTETAAEIPADDPGFGAAVEKKIFEVIGSMEELAEGFDFARLLTIYYRASVSGNDEDKSKVIRWFMGEYSTKTEAKRDLGVNIIITDKDWYNYLKLFALFFKRAGYSGFMIFIDELVNIYNIPNSVARQNNYEKLLTMYNDALQGRARYMGIIMGGTPQCVEDTRRGVYSYDALRSRLAEGRFGREGYRDMMAPVIHIEPLTPEEMVVLTEKIADIHAFLHKYERTMTEADMVEFIRQETGRIGAGSHITPREIIRDLIELLDIVLQKPGTDISEFIRSGAVETLPSFGADNGVNEGFAEFEI